MNHSVASASRNMRRLVDRITRENGCNERHDSIVPWHPCRQGACGTQPGYF